MAAADQPSTYCCACLNVRVPAQPAPSGAPTESTVSSDEERSFKVIYVPENGIQVAHPQLTARDREPIESVLRHKRDRRYVSVTCLLCNVLVYRVLHALTSAIAHDGPVLPTEDWVETEVLQSSTGVVEVHKSCVSGTAVDNLLQSPDYSSLLNIVLPPPPEGSSTPPSSASPAVSYIIAAKTANAASQTRTYLPPIPALFNPAPFTPSHLVFLHFAEAASVESARLRSAAEEEIATTIRRKLMELERSDGDLRRQVYTVWRVFSSRLASIRGEADLEGLSSPNGLGRRRNSNATGASSPTLVGPQSMRNFNPPSTKPVRPISAHGLPRESALSASLVTSKMHYRREGQPDSPGQPTPADRNAAGVSASVPANRRLDAYRSGAQDEGQAIILEAYRRKVNDDPNVAASLQVREGMHAAMNKRREQKREKLAAANAEQKEEGEEHPDPNGKGKEKAKEVNESATAGDAAESSTSPSRGSPKENGSKPRRKVTFDVKPAVVTINTNSATGQNTSPIAQQPSESINGDGIFDFEDDNGALEEANENNSTEVTTPVLPLIPSTPASTRPARSRKAATPTGLPSSLSSLRPSSLPGPSTLRNLSLLPRPTRTISPLNPAPPEAAVVNSESEGESGAASSTGKHTKDSPVRQNSGKASYPTVIKEEEDRSYDNDTDNDLDEDEDERSVEDSDPQTSTSPSALARSLPIAIGSTAMRRAHEQRKAYQPKTSLRDRPEMVVPALRSPDRPYATGETQKNDLGVIEEESGPAAELQGAGDRGRNHALKILVARSKIPDEKMWRSMAA